YPRPARGVRSRDALQCPPRLGPPMPRLLPLLLVVLLAPLASAQPTVGPDAKDRAAAEWLDGLIAHEVADRKPLRRPGGRPAGRLAQGQVCARRSHRHARASQRAQRAEDRHTAVDVTE